MIFIRGNEISLNSPLRALKGEFLSFPKHSWNFFYNHAFACYRCSKWKSTVLLWSRITRSVKIKQQTRKNKTKEKCLLYKSPPLGLPEKNFLASACVQTRQKILKPRFLCFVLTKQYRNGWKNLSSWLKNCRNFKR